VQTNRRVFLSRTLTKDVRISGTPTLDIVASVPGTQQNYSALLVDYGAGTQVTRGGEGIQNTTTRTCWGAMTDGSSCELGTTNGCPQGTPNPIPTTNDNACYLEVSKPTQSVTQWRVTRGTLDSSNRESLWFQNATPLTPNTMYHFKFPTFATEHVFKAGHQIGVVIVGNLFGGGASSGNVAGGGPYPSATSASPAQAITIDTRQSKIVMPVLGGYDALATAGGTDAETVAPVFGPTPDVTVHTANANGIAVNYTLPTATDNEDPTVDVTCDPPPGSTFKPGSTVVTCTARDANGNTATKTFNVIVGLDQTPGGTVPATLSLTIAAPAQFGAFTPGITKTYFATTNANVISTAGDALLSVADPSSFGTGHLVNGTFILPQPLQARARNAANTGTAYNNVGSSASPLNLLTWSAPISNDAVSLEFSQLVKSNDPLRTGTYAKSLTFTLSTTQP
jgi:X-Pro dipeptidyl-peptidase